MKNIRFYFGYYAQSRWSRFTYWLCKNVKFIPSIELDLYRRHGVNAGSSAGQYCKLKHQIHIGIFNFYGRWYKFIDGKWKFDNLSNA